MSLTNTENVKNLNCSVVKASDLMPEICAGLISVELFVVLFCF